MTIKLIIIKIQTQNWEIWLWFLTRTEKFSAQFQLKNWNAPAKLDLARNTFSSVRLSSGTFSSNSSLVPIPIHKRNNIPNSFVLKWTFWNFRWTHRLGGLTCGWALGFEEKGKICNLDKPCNLDNFKERFAR